MTATGGDGDAGSTGGATQVGALHVNAPSKRISTMYLQDDRRKRKRVAKARGDIPETDAELYRRIDTNARRQQRAKGPSKPPSSAARLANKPRVRHAGGGRIDNPHHEERATRNILRQEKQRQEEVARQRRNATRAATHALLATAVTYGVGSTIAGGQVGAKRWNSEKGKYTSEAWKPNGLHVELKINHNRLLGAPRKKGDSGVLSYRFTQETPPGRKVYWSHPRVGTVMGDDKTTYIIPAVNFQRKLRHGAEQGVKRHLFRKGEPVQLVIKHPGHDDQSIHGRRPSTTRQRRRSRVPVATKGVGRSGSGTAHYDSLGRFTTATDPHEGRKRFIAGLTGVVVIGAAGAAASPPVRRKASELLTTATSRRGRVDVTEDNVIHLNSRRRKAS